MKRKHGYFDTLADRFMELDSPVYGDERERASFMEASTFAMALGVFGGLAAALVAALLGQLLLPVALLMMIFLLSGATVWYAGRRGTDLEALLKRMGEREQAVYGVIYSGGLFAISGAMLYTVYAGHGLIPMPEVELAPTGANDLLRAVSIGMLAGGTLAMLADLIMSMCKLKKSKPQPGSGADAEDP